MLNLEKQQDVLFELDTTLHRLGYRGVPRFSFSRPFYQRDRPLTHKLGLFCVVSEEGYHLSIPSSIFSYRGEIPDSQLNPPSRIFLPEPPPKVHLCDGLIYWRFGENPKEVGIQGIAIQYFDGEMRVDNFIPITHLFLENLVKYTKNLQEQK